MHQPSLAGGSAVSISSLPFLIASILAHTLFLGCADPEVLRLKASEEIRATCNSQGCLEPLLVEVIVNGNLRQYKELAGIPADPEHWEYLFPTGRHARALEEFYRLKLTAIKAILGMDASSPVSNSPEQDNAATPSLLGPIPGHGDFLERGLLAPYTPNAYGPGLNMDATGHSFIWQPQGGGVGFPDPTLQVKPNAYGLGVGMDQYGRPVRPACPPGWAGSC
jgi:hypothetical protein